MSHFWDNFYPPKKKLTNPDSKVAKKLKGLKVKQDPVEGISGRKIATTFWGEAWCRHLETFSDYSNRLPRGRTYVRNGSVRHLQIERGVVMALVAGTRLYEVKVSINEIPKKRWQGVKKDCQGGISTLLELLRGNFSEKVMKVVADPQNGLFPRAKEMTFSCSCPDWATMCKHVAAVLYGVGSRLDSRPELLFTLRGTDPAELIDGAAELTGLTDFSGKRGNEPGGSDDYLDESALGDIFGIDIDSPAPSTVSESATGSGPKRRPGRPPKSRAVQAPVSSTSPETPMMRLEGGAKRPGKAAREEKKSSRTLPPRDFTGEMVKRIRTDLGLTVQGFADLVEVTPVTVYRWEGVNGPISLRRPTRTKLLRAWRLHRDLDPTCPPSRPRRPGAERVNARAKASHRERPETTTDGGRGAKIE